MLLLLLLLFLFFFKFKRQREGKASPLRHSKDDSDTIDLAPSHFPPLPTSPLPLFVSILTGIILFAVDHPDMVDIFDCRPSHVWNVTLIDPYCI